MLTHHRELHGLHHSGWLRAAVLGANDGIISTASLAMGMSAAQASQETVLLSAIAGLVAGSLAMATGEYVSVATQADAEAAALKQESAEIAADYDSEVSELSHLYQARGVSPALARQVAQELMQHNALDAHARDELGIAEHTTAKPLQAALASAASFAVGAALPLVVVYLAPVAQLSPWVAGSALLSLASLGALAAKIGRAPVVPSVLRISFWSALAMLGTALVGRLFGAVV
jgi:vacuolar iron transporter family protein